MSISSEQEIARSIKKIANTIKELADVIKWCKWADLQLQKLDHGNRTDHIIDRFENETNITQ